MNPNDLAPDPTGGRLTAAEIEAVRLLGQFASLFVHIVADGPTRAADVAETFDKIHQLQHAVMAQAAARAHPELFRLLGSTVTPPWQRQAPTT